jgi:hypothetical protein
MIFRAAARYPVDPRVVFVLALSVFSGVTALALKVGPDSLESLIPRWGVLLWGTMLALGSAVTLIGMAFQTAWGVILEQIGSMIVGVTAIFYSVLAIVVVGPGLMQTAGIILAWGVACLIRWGQLQTLIHSAIERKRKEEVVQRLADQLEARLGREKAEHVAREATK